MGGAAWSKCSLGGAPARLLRLLRARLAALDDVPSQGGEAVSPGAQTLPRVLELATSETPIPPPLTIQARAAPAARPVTSDAAPKKAAAPKAAPLTSAQRAERAKAEQKAILAKEPPARI